MSTPTQSEPTPGNTLKFEIPTIHTEPHTISASNLPPPTSETTPESTLKFEIPTSHTEPHAISAPPNLPLHIHSNLTSPTDSNSKVEGDNYLDISSVPYINSPPEGESEQTDESAQNLSLVPVPSSNNDIPEFDFRKNPDFPFYGFGPQSTMGDYPMYGPPYSTIVPANIPLDNRHIREAEGIPMSSVPAQPIQEDVASTSTDSKYFDITPYLSLPQSKAAEKLGIPTSTLSKRWKEAVRGRKWPYRSICKLDKEIMTLLHNISHADGDSGNLPPKIERELGELLRRREEELKPVTIRL